MALEPEFDALARELVETLRAHPEEFGAASGVDSAPSLPGGLPAFVLPSETGLLVGEPPAQSLSLAFPVFTALAQDQVWAFGPPFASLGPGPHDFAQVVVATMPAPATRQMLARLAALRSLARRLPGYFAHASGQETSARIHRDLLRAGFDARALAAVHVAQARAEGHSGPLAVAVGVPSQAALRILRPFAARLRALQAELAAPPPPTDPAGLEGCEGKDCRTCDERVVCDKVREVLAATRREPRRAR